MDAMTSARNYETDCDEGAGCRNSDHAYIRTVIRTGTHMNGHTNRRLDARMNGRTGGRTYQIFGIVRGFFNRTDEKADQTIYRRNGRTGGLTDMMTDGYSYIWADECFVEAQYDREEIVA